MDGLEDRGIIRRSESQWRNLTRMIRKVNGGIRIVINLMALNDLTVKDSYQIPEIRKIIGATQGSSFFTILDLKEGYYQVRIKEEHMHKTAFEFENKIYEWCGMVMGFKNCAYDISEKDEQSIREVLGQRRGGISR